MLETVTSLRVVFRNLGGLKMLGEKNLGKCSLHIGIGIGVVLFLIFISFNTTPLIQLAKIILIRNCKSAKGD